MRILSSLNRKSNGRSGASLTEVLIAILILSIGVSSVFALFPISILSSIKATQLTNAKLMQGNVEQYLRTNPGYLTVNTTGGVVQGNSWQAQTSYAPGSLVVPTPKNGSFRSEPFRAYRAIILEWSTGGSFPPPGASISVSPGFSGLNEPSWILTTINFGGTRYRVVLDRVQVLSATDRRMIVWEPTDIGRLSPIAFPGNPEAFRFTSWVVDPLGATTFGPLGDGTLTTPFEFGCYCPDATGTTGVSVTTAGVAPWTRGLPRINGGATTLTTAREISSHPDSWAEVARMQPLTLNSPMSIQLQPNPEISIDSFYNRIVVRNGDGTRAVVRDGPSLAFNSTTGEITFADPLPAS
ncbi:MAG: hypothetical protein KDA66_21045, partial [Planctomycetaceae bacterium]|nr:hypothetical protein [Planctomycetaceae bacterium]